MTLDENKSELDVFITQIQKIRGAHGLNYRSELASHSLEWISDTDLRDLAMMQNLFYPTKFTSHRKIVGPLIVFLKEQVVKILDPFFRRRLVRQFEINQFTWNMANILRQQQIHITALEKRLTDLESKN